MLPCLNLRVLVRVRDSPPPPTLMPLSGLQARLNLHADHGCIATRREGERTLRNVGSHRRKVL